MSEVRYQWDGNNLIGQQQIYADGTPGQHTQWLYQPDSFIPLIQIQNNELFYVVTDHGGTPRELISEQGEIVWRSEPKLWQGFNPTQLKQAAINYWSDSPKAGSINCDLRYQGQIFDSESGLYYNRYRYYCPELCQYISPDPIGLAGGLRPQGYVHNPMDWVDPFGLVAAETPGYSVYGLYDLDASGRPVGDPYYIGITNDLERREGEHVKSGRLLGSNTGMVELDGNITYGEARGYEQANIEHFGTKTGIKGDPISEINRGNKVNSFDHGNTTRDRERQAYFENAYNEKMRTLPTVNKGCKV